MNTDTPPLALDPLDLEADDLRIARETIAQAWCSKENSHKVMDSDLAEAGAKLFAGWIGTARQHLRNEEYYRGLLDECGQAIGEAAYTQDDGGKSDSVLRAKIPELVRALASSPPQEPAAPAGKRVWNMGVPTHTIEAANGGVTPAPAPSQPQEAGDRPLPDLPSAPRPGDWDELASLRKWQEDAAATFDQIMRMADAGTWATFGDVINAVQGLVIAEASDPAPIPCAVPGCSRANHKFEAPSQAAPIGRECWVLFDAEHVAKRVRVIGESGFLNIPGWKWVRMVEAPPIPPRAAPIWGGAFQDAIKAYQEWRRLKAWAMGADTSKAWQDVDDAQGEFHRRMGEAIALPAVPPHAGGWDLAPMAPLREAVKAALDAWNEWVIDTDQQAPSHDWLDAMSDLEIAYAQDGDGSGKPVAGADTPSEGK